MGFDGCGHDKSGGGGVLEKTFSVNNNHNTSRSFMNLKWFDRSSHLFPLKFGRSQPEGPEASLDATVKQVRYPHFIQSRPENSGGNDLSK